MSEQEYAEFEAMIDALEDAYDAEQEFLLGIEEDIFFFA